MSFNDVLMHHMDLIAAIVISVATAIALSCGAPAITGFGFVVALFAMLLSHFA